MFLPHYRLPSNPPICVLAHPFNSTVSSQPSSPLPAQSAYLSPPISLRLYVSTRSPPLLPRDSTLRPPIATGVVLTVPPSRLDNTTPPSLPRWSAWLLHYRFLWLPGPPIVNPEEPSSSFSLRFVPDDLGPVHEEFLQTALYRSTSSASDRYHFFFAFRRGMFRVASISVGLLQSLPFLLPAPAIAPGAVEPPIATDSALLRRPPTATAHSHVGLHSRFLQCSTTTTPPTATVLLSVCTPTSNHYRQQPLFDAGEPPPIATVSSIGSHSAVGPV